ncbi:MAG: CHASE2 domain-containing protein [Thermodesulfobacteriota bacterium]
MGSQTELKKKQVSFIIPALSIAWCVAAVVLLFVFPDTFDTANNRLYDWKMGLCQRPEPASQVVHVDVDDDAIAEYGLWPWDRALSAKIVDRLAKFGAKAVVFDILYTMPGRSPEGNQLFFEAIKKAGMVIPAMTMGTAEQQGQWSLEADRGRFDALYQYRAWVVKVPRWFQLLKTRTLKETYVPLEPIIRNSASLGHVKATPDADGVHRRIPLFVKLEDKLIPSLSLAALQVYWNFSPHDVKFSSDGTVQILREGRTVKIPVDSKGMMMINWAGIWDEFKHYTVNDVLGEEPDFSRASRYKGKIVIIGVTGTGSTDFGVTPLGVQSPLSRIQSNALSTIIMEEFIVTVRASPIPVILALILAVLFAIVSVRLRFSVGIVLGAGIPALFVVVCLLAWVSLKLDLPVTEFLAVFCPAALIALAGKGVSIEQQASRMQETT